MTVRISTESQLSNAPAAVLAVDGAGGLSPRSRFIAGVLTVLLLLGAGVAIALADALPIFGGRAQNVAAAGSAADVPTRSGSGASPAGAETLSAAVVSAEWDGPAVHLDWTGSEYARAETTFIGERRASPGDRVVRTLNVVNAGPGDGVAAVTLDLSEVIPEGALNPDLAQDVTLFWDIAGVTGEDTFAALNSRERVSVAEVAVAQGATVPVTVGFEMAAAVETSNAAGADSTLLSFDVGVNLTGETEPFEPPTLAITGATGVFALLCIAAGLVLLGVLLIARRRRRAEEELVTVSDDVSTDPARRGLEW